MIRQLVLGAYMFAAREKIFRCIRFGITHGSLDVFVLEHIPPIFIQINKFKFVKKISTYFLMQVKTESKQPHHCFRVHNTADISHIKTL